MLVTVSTLLTGIVPSSLQTVYVEFSNTGTCFSSVGRTYWPFPVAQERHHN